MKDGLGVFLWKISVALYLITNGVLGLKKDGDFESIFNKIFGRGDTTNLFCVIAGVIALIAGIALVLEMLNISVSFLETLILIIAIIWAVFVVIEVFGWITKDLKDPWGGLQLIAVHLMVFASLLIASKKA